MRKVFFSSVMAAVLAGVAVPAVGAGEDSDPRVAVIVRSTTGHDAAAAAVRSAGGRVTIDLPIVDGVAASVPAAGVARLRSHPGVTDVSADYPVTVQGSSSSSSSSLPKQVFDRSINSDQLVSEGVTGVGVTVALIDTGVSPMPDLAGKIQPVADPSGNGKTVACVNMSGDLGSDGSPDCTDYYGHGTFLAGLITGSGQASGGQYKGVAPGAKVLSIKIAGRNGSADVSKVLAGIQWVVTFGKDYGVRVLNLSLGTNSSASYRIDPLNYAVEKAWGSGLAVIVSAGNRGRGTNGQGRTISKPADDPLVITVGADDDRESPARSDDRTPNFSSRGPTLADGLAKPDVTAPGGRVVSLKAPGSLVAQHTSSPVLDSYTRGSGTSFSAAIVSGVAALAFQANPTWTPDRFKFALNATASRVAGTDEFAEGFGLINAFKAVRQAPPGLANQTVTVLSDGSGSLDGSRGDVRVTGPCSAAERALDPNCTKPLEGENTAQGREFDRDQYMASWNGSSWYGGQFGDDPTGVGLLGSSWYGSSWYGSSWYGSSWYGTEWQGSSWYGNEDGSIYGIQLPGSAFYGSY